MLEDKLTDNTVIDTGHYSYLMGPTELDLFLWEQGVKLYVYAKERYNNIGLMLLVDDVKDVVSNEQRRLFEIGKLPENYNSVLEKYKVDRDEVIIISQDRMKEKGRQLLRAKEESRDSFGKCELIVATTVRKKERLGYINSINFYDKMKTCGGLDLKRGTKLAQDLFRTTIQCHYTIFDENKNIYRYFCL